MYCVLETNLTRKFAADLPLKIFLIVANLANNFQDLVAKVKNLVALAPVGGAREIQKWKTKVIII